MHIAEANHLVRETAKITSEKKSFLMYKYPYTIQYYSNYTEGTASQLS